MITVRSSCYAINTRIYRSSSIPPVDKFTEGYSRLPLLFPREENLRGAEQRSEEKNPLRRRRKKATLHPDITSSSFQA